MTKKKVTSQTTIIIVLSILLCATLVFGGVYAYYSTATNKILGQITMANLNIKVEPGAAEDSSEYFVTATNVVPGQSLRNDDPLNIINNSNTNIYLAVVYSLEVTFVNHLPEYSSGSVNENPPAVNPEEDTPDLSSPLINVNNPEWKDCLFEYEYEDGTIFKFRYLMKVDDNGVKEIGSDEETITVVESEHLALHQSMGNNYQSAKIILSFKAFAIGSQEMALQESVNKETTVEGKCNAVMNAIFMAFNRDTTQFPQTIYK